MKIGIMTFFRPINYGAFLQAYALTNRLNQENDINSEIIDFIVPEEKAYYDHSIKYGKNLAKVFFDRKRYKIFQEALLHLHQCKSEYSCCGEIEDFIKIVDQRYDIIIAGSDEVWKVNSFRGFPTPYFLPGNLHCKKVAYAASGRSPFALLKEEDRMILKDYINDFSYIGVRDLPTLHNVEEVASDKTKIHLNYDPTFVYDFHSDPEKGRLLLKKYFGITFKKKVIGVMYQESLRAKPSLIQYLKKKFGDKFDFVSLYDWNLYIPHSPEITPFEWIDMIAAVDGVISMYFHGICFSLITETPFYAIDVRESKTDQSKIYDLLKRTNLLDYYSSDPETAINEGKLESFLNGIKLGEVISYGNIVHEARNEFGQFIEELRTLNNIGTI